jgi:hypothetical protein
MRFLGFFLFLIFTTACGAQSTVNRTQTTNPPSEIPIPAAKQAVLVELFTSQG